MSKKKRRNSSRPKPKPQTKAIVAETVDDELDLDEDIVEDEGHEIYAEQELDVEEPREVPYVARWDILPPEVKGEPSTLVLYGPENEPLTYLLLTEEYAGDLLDALNRKLKLVSIEPDEWSIKVPEDASLPPVLNFFSVGVNTASVQLDDEALKALAPRLNAFYEKTQEQRTFKAWLKRHKVSGGLLIFVVAAGFIASTIGYYF